MRVLHVLGRGTLPRNPETGVAGGIARVALELARRQAADGHEVWLVAPDPRGWRGLWEGVHLVGLRTAKWAEFRWRGRHYDLRWWLPIAVFTRRRRFEVVHAHEFTRFSHLAGRIRISHSHNDPLWDDGEDSLEAQKGEFRRMASGTRAQIAVSRYAADRLALGLRAVGFGDSGRGTVRVIPNGVELERFRPEHLGADRRRLRLSWGVGPNDPVFLFVGALHPHKGVDHLARAFAGLRERGSDARLVLAGGARLWAEAGQEGSNARTPYEELLAELLAEPLRSRAAIFLGLQSGLEMPGVFAASDVVVLPSVVTEAFGLSALEGMAAGKPVIATRVGGVPELVGRDNGILVPAGNAQALAGAMERLAGDPRLRWELGNGAGETATRYTWESSALQVEELYRELMNGDS